MEERGRGMEGGGNCSFEACGGRCIFIYWAVTNTRRPQWMTQSLVTFHS